MICIDKLSALPQLPNSCWKNVLFLKGFQCFATSSLPPWTVVVRKWPVNLPLSGVGWSWLKKKIISWKPCSFLSNDIGSLTPVILAVIVSKDVRKYWSMWRLRILEPQKSRVFANRKYSSTIHRFLILFWWGVRIKFLWTHCVFVCVCVWICFLLNERMIEEERQRRGEMVWKIERESKGILYTHNKEMFLRLSICRIFFRERFRKLGTHSYFFLFLSAAQKVHHCLLSYLCP